MKGFRDPRARRINQSVIRAGHREGRRAAVAEPLERRRLLCATGAPGFYAGTGVAQLSGTEGPDDINISIEGGCNAVDDNWIWYVSYKLNQQPLVRLLTQDFKMLSLNTLGGNDTVRVNGLREHDLTLDLGSGDDNVIINYVADVGGFNGPAYGIWDRSEITVFGNTGTDAITSTSNYAISSTPTLTFGYLINDNTVFQPGTRVERSAQRVGENVFVGGYFPLQYNSVESLTMTAGPNSGPSVIQIDSLIATSATIVTGNSPTTLTVATGVTGNVTATGGTGNDVFNIGKQANGATTHVDGGGGSNTLNLMGTAGADAFTVLPSGLITGHTVASVANIQTYAVDAAGGVDTFLFQGVPTLPYTMKGGAGDDVFTAASTIPFLPAIDGGAGSNTLVLDHQTVPLPTTYRFGPSGVQVTNAGIDKLFAGSNLSRIRANAGTQNDQFIFGGQASYFAEAHGGAGDDSFYVGNGNVAASFGSIAMYGEADSDAIVFDDRLSSNNLPWTLTGDSTTSPRRVFLGINEYAYEGFERVGILGGSASEEYRFAGQFNIGLDIDAGGGADTFILGFQDSVVFNHAVSLNGGSQGTTFNINQAAVWFFTTLTLDGGNGFNYLNVNIPLVTRFQIGDGYFIPGGDGPFLFRNINTSVFNGNANDNVYTIYSAGSYTGTVAINGNLGNDSFLLAPQPSGYSFNNLTLDGNQGTDTFTYDASALLTDNSYTVGPNYFAIDRGFNLFETVRSASTNQFAVIGGPGNDTFAINSLTPDRPTTVNGGGGNDTYNVFGSAFGASAPVSLTLADSGGFDTFNLNDQDLTNISNANYGANASGISRVGTPIPYTGIDVTNINGGAGADVLTVLALPAAAGELRFFGGPGNDALTGSPLNSIANRITFDGQTGTNNTVTLDDSLDSTADIAHLDATTLGAYPGDSLFGAGGSLAFSNVASLGLTLGTGGDTVFARPNSTAAVSISGNSPFFPADTLNLALAAAQNYVITGTPSNGSVTSANLKPLTYNGFETGPVVDAVAPVVVAADINLNGIPGPAAGLKRQSLDVRFNENVLRLGAASLELRNLATGQTIPTANITVEYDTASNIAHFTFPGYINGVLPDGNYHGRIYAGLPDSFGNGLAADAPFDFFFLNADADHDRTVGPGDFNMLASHFGLTGETFATGDFDYDGRVGPGDFNLLATRFGTTLARPLSALQLADGVVTSPAAVSAPPAGAASTTPPLTTATTRPKRPAAVAPRVTPWSVVVDPAGRRRATR